MQVGGGNASYAKSDAFEGVPRDGVVDRSEVPFRLSPSRGGHGSDILRGDGIHCHEQGVELRSGFELSDEVHDGAFIERERLRAMGIPIEEVFSDGSRVGRLDGIGGD